MQALLDVSTVGDRLDDADADDVVDAIASDRRRRALGALAEHDSRLSLSTLARRVCRLETDGGEVDESERGEIELSLHHADLPKLDELGFVSYDPDAREVELDVDPRTLELGGALIE